MVISGAIVGIAADDALSGADVDVAITGVFTLPKVSALAIAIGGSVYFDNATKLANKTASGNTKICTAVSIGANPSGTVNVRLSGF